MLDRNNRQSIDRRDEIVLAIIALLIPLATIPAMLGLESEALAGRPDTEIRRGPPESLPLLPHDRPFRLSPVQSIAVAQNGPLAAR